jgi:hypothetical protein
MEGGSRERYMYHATLRRTLERAEESWALKAERVYAFGGWLDGAEDEGAVACSPRTPSSSACTRGEAMAR